MQKWNFPSNGNGKFDGYHDAAIDHFTGDRLGSFIREAIQNSLDARLDETRPVRVSFRLDSLSKSEAPAIFELLPWVKLAESSARKRDDQYSEDQDNGEDATSSEEQDNEVEFFANMVSDLEKTTEISVLSVHDTNTRGLSGSLTGPKGSWFALTKGNGVNEKHSAGSLGAFGHGSKAPFAMTNLRTVFYYTRLPETDNHSPGEERFQGKSILRSIVLKEGTYTSGTGFFGKGDSCLPIVGEEVPTWIKNLRTACGFVAGTTVAVPMPKMFGDPDAWKAATFAVLASFYYAIKMGTLEISIQDQEIDADNLAQTFDTHKTYIENLGDAFNEGNRSRMHSVETIHSFTQSGTLNSPTFGKVNYFVRTGPEIQWRKVGIARKTGMLITRDAKKFQRFNGLTPFDLFICVGEEPGNSILRSMENPRHDNFEVERIENEDKRKAAEKAYEAFSQEIRELLAELAPLKVEQTSLIDDLDDLFQLPDFEESVDGEGNEASTKPKISGVRTTKPSRTLRPTKHGTGTGKGVKRTPAGKHKPPPWLGKELFDSNGSAVIVTSWKDVTQTEHLRIVPQGSNSSKALVYLTVAAPGDYILDLFRAGEQDIQFLAIKDERSKRIKTTKENERVTLELQIEPRDLDYAIDGVTHVVS